MLMHIVDSDTGKDLFTLNADVEPSIRSELWIKDKVWRVESVEHHLAETQVIYYKINKTIINVIDIT